LQIRQRLLPSIDIGQLSQLALEFFVLSWKKILVSRSTTYYPEAELTVTLVLIRSKHRASNDQSYDL
jgi:hypothetical protein